MGTTPSADGEQVSIEEDLHRKFCEDMSRAINSYAQLCEVAGISPKDQLVSLGSTLSGSFTRMMIDLGMSKDRFMQIMGQSYDHHIKSNKASRRAR
jgi:hypothetical protein